MQYSSEHRQSLASLLPKERFNAAEFDDISLLDNLLLKRRLSACLDSRIATAVSNACLLIALFGSGIVVLLDLPDEPTNFIVDVIMVLVMLYFCVECGLRAYAHRRTYFLSFYFWMDVLGSFSMVFDMSFLFGEAGKVSTTGKSGMDVVVMRAARTARVGARAGRVLKPLRFLFATLLEGSKTKDKATAKVEEAEPNYAKILGTRLSRILSSKVALLTVILVFGVPFLSLGCYPQDDFSGASWVYKLEKDYWRAYEVLKVNARESSDIFEKTVEDMLDFYLDFDYPPFELLGFDEHVMVNGRQKSIPGRTLLSGNRPIRKQHIVRHEVVRCQFSRPLCEKGEKAAVLFNFTKSNQYLVIAHFGVIVFVVLCMCVESYDVSQSVMKLVVKPIDKMLETAKSLADVFHHSAFQEGLYVEDVDELDEDVENDESYALQMLFSRTARLAKVLMRKKHMSEKDMHHLSEESKGVLLDVLDVSRTQKGMRGSVRESRRRSECDDSPLVHLKSGHLRIDVCMLEDWGLNIIEMERRDLKRMAGYLLFDSSIGLSTGRIFCDLECFQSFLTVLSPEYYDNPYHNFNHACDVLASCTRILTEMHWHDWLSDLEAYAILVSCLAHDVRHPGKTNPFLVETRDPLALRYNDKSPLESMHCATLFEIVSDSSRNVFKKFTKADFKKVRSVCIDAILHTDNSLHFEMVKQVQSTFEVSSDLCQAQAAALVDDDVVELQEDYLQSVLSEHIGLWLKVIVHLADVSNPLKTFELNQLWAARVCDEFFNQGDAEKELGIPVGMLNDRDRVNRAGAEHGFIVFLVAPLLFAVTRCLPMCVPFADQVASNVQRWRDVWVQKANPPVEDIKKRDADIRTIEEQVQSLRAQAKALSM